jgi:hypothetical protein
VSQVAASQALAFCHPVDLGDFAVLRVGEAVVGGDFAYIQPLDVDELTLQVNRSVF